MLAVAVGGGRRNAGVGHGVGKHPEGLQEIESLVECAKTILDDALTRVGGSSLLWCATPSTQWPSAQPYMSPPFAVAGAAGFEQT